MNSPTIIEITVAGEPVGQPRQDGRVLMIPGKRPTVQMYTPKVREKIGQKPNGDPIYGPDKLEPWVERIKLACFGKAPGGVPITGLVRVDIDAFFARCGYHEAKRFPKNHPLAGQPIPSGKIPHHARPDGDNVEKAVWDAMVRAKLLRDDSQICGHQTNKWYCAVGGVPGVKIRVEVLNIRTDGQLSLIQEAA